MKITDVKVYTMDSFRMNWNFVKVETDEGLYGWGESSLGTNENTIEVFFEAGALGVGTGISILKPELIEAIDYDAITELAEIHVNKIRECQKKYR